jgi:YegS/Rv2252/BmrU family lipid kinase
MSDRGRFLLLVNPSAGGGSTPELLPQFERALANQGLEFRRVLTTSLEHGCAEARDAAAAGETTLVLSGDGLVGQVGGALANSGATMGVLPGGRGNDLARVLGIPTDPEGAAAVVAGANVREIDVGEINGSRFLGIASCGFDSDANRIANEAKLVRGQLVYLYAALKALAGWRPATFTLTLDGHQVEVRGYSVGAANNKAYGGGMYAAPDAELDDGLLDVVSLAEMSKTRFLTKVLTKVREGTHVDLPEACTHRAREVRIEADRPFAVYADGDHAADLPATVTLLPRALRVLVPA